jgi:hypothetical protein
MSNLRGSFTQNLALGALDQSISWNYDVLLDCILIHASTDITESLSIIFDSVEGSDFDTVLDSKSFSANSDYVYRPAREQLFKRGDILKITLTNANTTGMVGVTIMARVKQQEE